MATPGSISKWLADLRNDENTEDAAAELWNRYFSRLLEMAALKLRNSRGALGDEEDVVLETLQACLAAIREGRYQDNMDRDSFWFLLVRVAERKAIDLQRKMFAKKRRGNEGVINESAFSSNEDSNVGSRIDEVVSDEPSPEFAAILTEESKRLFDLLDDRHQQVARLRIEGYSNGEIGQQIGRSVAAVERYVRLIRDIWSQELGDDQ